MLKIFSIYKATNLFNQKCYIGFDSDWNCKCNRKFEHEYYAFNPKYKAYNIKFYRAIRKYGKSNFEWEIVYQSLDGDHCLNIMEPYFIKEYDSYNNGYNMTLGGDGSKGYKHNKETIEKMKLIHGGKNNAFYGSKHKNQTIENISSKMIGKINAAKKYIVIDPLGKIHNVLNLNEFCKNNNLHQGAMVYIAQNKKIHHKGWKCYYDQTSPQEPCNAPLE